ncbi:MAG: PQQ-binding-like beta-propeller repeat protein, partial [Cyclobacteriaceae bacterium]
MKRIYIAISTACFSVCALAQTVNEDFVREPIVKWRFKTNAPIFSTPVVSDGFTFFGGMDSTLYALDTQTGDLKWKVKTNGEIRSTVSVVDDRLYLLGGNGVLSCFYKATGKMIWVKVFDTTALFLGERKYDFADYFHSSPLIQNGVIYFGSGGNYIYAVNAENGEIIWNFKTGDIVHSRPTILGEKLFIGCFDGYLYALNIRDGSLVWKFKSVGQQYFPKGEMQGFPVGSGGSVFIGSRDFNLYSINAETGQGNWNIKFPKGWAFSSVVADTVLFLGTAEDHLMLALDARTGKELWKTDLKFHIFGQSELSSSLVYVPTIW